MDGGEVVLSAEEFLVEVGVHHIEADFRELHIEIGVAKRIVSNHGFMCVGEAHGGRLVGQCTIAGCIVAVDSELGF